MPDIAGLKLIVPTSATATGAGSSATASASGKVTFNTAATVSINGCFSATYNNFLVVLRSFRNTSTSDFFIRMRASGSDNTTTNSYVSQGLYAYGTTVSGSRITSNVGYFGGTGSAQRDGYHLYFYNPYLAQPTAMRSVTVWGLDNAAIGDYAMTHNQSTSYDGFTFYPLNPGTITGDLTIYGLSQ